MSARVRPHGRFTTAANNAFTVWVLGRALWRMQRGRPPWRHR